MAINTEALRISLKEKIKEAFDAPIDENSNSEEVKRTLSDNIANAIADALDAWIKTATVTVNPGITVVTSGSPTSQTGVTTSSGIGLIS